MSEHQTPTPDVTEPGEPRRRRFSFRHRLFFLAGLPVLAFTGLFAHRAMAGHGGWGGWGHGGQEKSPEAIRERMDRGAHFVLDKLEGTDTQHDQVDAILDELVGEVVDVQGQAQALKKKFRAALLKKDVDARELEAIRKEAVALFDAASKKGVTRIVEVSEVLTDDQREELVAFMKKRGGRHHD